MSAFALCPRSLPWAIGLAALLAMPAAAQTGDVSNPDTRDPAAVVLPEPLAPPPVGYRFADPAFGTMLERLTDRSSTGGYATHVYSQLQAFSSDGGYLMLIEDDRFVVHRRDDMQRMPIDLTDVNAPRWHPTRPHVLVYFDSNEDTVLQVESSDVTTGLRTTEYVFPARFTGVRTTQSFEELSDDGRWIAGLASRSDGRQAIFAVNLATQELRVEMTVDGLYETVCTPDPDWGAVEPDWIGVSPLGRYLMVQWPRDGTTRCSGLESFDMSSGQFAGRVSDGHQHGDLGTLPGGSGEFFMTYEMGHPSGALYLGYRLLPGTATAAPPLYLQRIGWDSGGHISCRGPAGVCLVTSYFDTSNGWEALEGELFLQYVDGSVLRLAHHRSTSCGYWVQPRASLSRDGAHAIWASDWAQFEGSDSCADAPLGRGDVYIAEIGTGKTPVIFGPDSPVLFTDTFDDGTASDWQVVRRRWGVVNGRLRGDAAPQADIVAPSGACERCKVQAMVRLLTGGGQLALFGWYRDAQNHVELLLGDDDTIVLRHRRNGWIVRRSGARLAFDAGGVYSVEISFDGARVIAAVNGQPLVQLAASGLYGRPGFGVRAPRRLTASGDMDALTVTPMP